MAIAANKPIETSNGLPKIPDPKEAVNSADQKKFESVASQPPSRGPNGAPQHEAPTRDGSAPDYSRAIPGDAHTNEFAPSWENTDAGRNFMLGLQAAANDLKIDSRDELPNSETIGSGATAYINNGTRSIDGATVHMETANNYLDSLARTADQHGQFLNTDDRTKIASSLGEALHTNADHMARHTEGLIGSVVNDVKAWDEGAKGVLDAQEEVKQERKLAIIGVVSSVAGVVASGGVAAPQGAASITAGLDALGLAGAAGGAFKDGSELSGANNDAIDEAEKAIAVEFGADFAHQVMSLARYGEESGKMKATVDSLMDGSHAAVIRTGTTTPEKVAQFDVAASQFKSGVEANGGAMSNFGRASEKARATIAMMSSLNSLTSDSSDEMQDLHAKKLSDLGWNVNNPPGGDFAVSNFNGTYGRSNALVRVSPTEALGFGKNRDNIGDQTVGLGEGTRFLSYQDIENERLANEPVQSPKGFVRYR